MTASSGPKPNALSCRRRDDLGGWSGSWDPHACLRAVGPQQDKGARCGAGVAYVTDGCPRVPGHARVRDMIRDAPEGWNIGDTAGGA
jgi:hypothetical protein